MVFYKLGLLVIFHMVWEYFGCVSLVMVSPNTNRFAISKTYLFVPIAKGKG